MKRASYKHAVHWIAHNDAPGDCDGFDSIRGFASVVLVADLFDVDQDKVARDVLEVRRKELPECLPPKQSWPSEPE